MNVHEKVDFQSPRTKQETFFSKTVSFFTALGQKIKAKGIGFIN